MDDASLKTHSSQFAEAIRECFRDMLGVEIAHVPSDVVIRDFSPEFSMVAMIHFTGPVQGNYALSLDETTAAKFIGAWQEGMPVADLRAARVDYGGMLKELLNTAVGMSIPCLEEDVGRLVYHSPLVVYGELDAPSVPSGCILLETESGPLSCCLMVDEAGNDAERLLRQAVEDLRRARHEVESCMRVLDDLLHQSRMGTLAPEILLEAERVLEEVRVNIGGSGDSLLLG